MLSIKLTSCALLALAAISLGNGTGHNITEGTAGFSKGRNATGAGTGGMDDVDADTGCCCVAVFDVAERDGSVLTVPAAAVSSPVLTAETEIK